MSILLRRHRRRRFAGKKLGPLSFDNGGLKIFRRTNLVGKYLRVYFVSNYVIVVRIDLCVVGRDVIILQLAGIFLH